MTDLIPAAVKLAAKRAALKTMAQTARGAGAAIVAAIGTTIFGVDWLAIAGIAGASVITVAWAGADAYLDKINNGIPEEYADVTLVSQSVLTGDERAVGTDAAIGRVLR